MAKSKLKSLVGALRRPTLQDFYHSFAVRGEKYWLGVVALLIILTRWVGRAQYLYVSDSVRYGLALDDYNVALHQPHPPGYGLYVLFAKPIYWLTGDHNVALIIVSIIFSVLAAWAVFYLAKKIYDAKIAWIALAIFVFSPLIWFHGQIALNYITDAFFAALFGVYAYSSIKHPKDTSSLWKASLALAIGGGFRPTLVVFMLPLWLWIVLRRKNLKTLIINGLIIVGVTLAWLLPAAWLSGGITSFWNATYSLIFDKSSLYNEFSVVSPAGFSRLWNYVTQISSYLLVGFGLSVVAVALYLVSLATPRTEDFKINYTNLIFWSLWLVPAVIFYLLVVFTVTGYLVILVPALSILVAVALNEVIKAVGLGLASAKHRKAFSTKLILVSAMFIIGVNTYNYFKADATVNPEKPTHYAIENINKLWNTLIPTIRSEFNPQSTIIGIDKPFISWGLQHFQYYLPEYVAYEHIFWGVYNPDGANWFMANDGKAHLVKTLDIHPTDSKMIVIQGKWSGAVPTHYETVSLVPYGIDGNITYFDLTDPKSIELIKKIKHVRFTGEEIEATDADAQGE